MITLEGEMYKVRSGLIREIKKLKENIAKHDNPPLDWYELLQFSENCLEDGEYECMVDAYIRF